MDKGSLYLIPCLLGDTEPLEVLPLSIKKAIDMIDEYIVENEKSARHFIKKVHPQKSQPSLTLHVLNKYTEVSEYDGFLKACMDGRSVGLISEAGAPGVADPGAEIVAIAHRKGIKVVPLVGPSSILLAMMASGMNGQSFAFNGYLPIDKAERKKRIKQFEKLSQKGQSQMFIETPYRNGKMIEDLLTVLEPGTKVCIAANITTPQEFISTKTVAQWKKAIPNIDKQPAIFILQA